MANDAMHGRIWSRYRSQPNVEDLITRLNVDEELEEEMKRDPAAALARIAAKPLSIVDTDPIIYRIAKRVLGLAVVVLLMWVGVKQLPQLLPLIAPPEALPSARVCATDDPDCFLGMATDTLSFIYSSINYWDRVSYWAAVAAIFFGTVATIMIALQGDDNRYWTRPVGIIATSLVTGIGGFTTSFHVPETIDKLVDVYSQAVERTNVYTQSIQGKSAQELGVEARKFSQDFTQIKAELLKIKGSASRIDLKQSSQGQFQGQQPPAASSPPQAQQSPAPAK